jgi:hypothetical protein
VHEGEFVRGSYGRIGVLGSAARELKAASDDGSGGGSASSDEDPLMGLKSVKSSAGGSAAGRKETPATPPSPLFGATTFVNPYSFAQRAALGGSDSSSSSDGDAPPSPLISKGKKLPPAAAAVPLLKLPAVNALQGQGAAGGGLLSGYDSWSDDDADAGSGGAAGNCDDDWSDTEAPQQQPAQTHTSHKLKPAAAESPPQSSSLPGTSSERVESWAARHAGSGLLGLMLYMRRCPQPRETKPSRPFV